jgi:hypothetical protein
MQNGVAVTGAGLLYHHDGDILKMARRFPKDRWSSRPEVFKTGGLQEKKGRGIRIGKPVRIRQALFPYRKDHEYR